MRLEDQCVSLELAKRLKELGVKQDSWFIHLGTIGVLPRFKTDIANPYPKAKDIIDEHSFAAFTVAELGEMLPVKIIDPDSGDKIDLACDFWSNIKRVMYIYSEECSSPALDAQDTTEANARAKMLICLIENGLHEP